MLNGGKVKDILKSGKGGLNPSQERPQPLRRVISGLISCKIIFLFCHCCFYKISDQSWFLILIQNFANLKQIICDGVYWFHYCFCFM